MCQLEQGQVKPTQKHESLGIHTPNTKNNAFLGNIFGCKKKRGEEHLQTTIEPSSQTGVRAHLPEWYPPWMDLPTCDFHRWNFSTISLMWSIKFQQNATSLIHFASKGCWKTETYHVCVVVRRSMFSRCHAYPKVKWATWGLSPLRQRDPLMI